MAKHFFTRSCPPPTPRCPGGRAVPERDFAGALTLADWVRLGHVALVEEAVEEAAEDAAGTVAAG